MVFAKLLRLRDKLSQKRQQLNNDEEKPFLEHLEDLRRTITRIVITLLVCSLCAMIWYKEFLAVVKWPAQAAGLDLVEDKNRLNDIAQVEWEKIKALALRAQGLTDSERTAFFEAASTLSADHVQYAKALLIYHAGYHFAPTVSQT